MQPLLYLKCPVCEKPAVDGMTHPRCRTKYTIDGLTSFFRYDGVIKKAIKQIKYRGAFDIVEELIQCIPDVSYEIIRKSYFLNRKSFLIPIPLHRLRQNYRGFNQAEIIAKTLGKRLNIPVRTNVLIRSKMTTPQVEMKDRKKRLANMKDVFSIHTSCFINPKSGFLLVDDVFTTGATLRSAASVLKHSGVQFVWGITLAQ